MKSFDETTDADWKFAFDVNFYGALYGIKAALADHACPGGGHIANTASGIGFCPDGVPSMYSATKSALIGLTGSLALRALDENDSPLHHHSRDCCDTHMGRKGSRVCNNP